LQSLIEQGATVLDLGAESTRPGATPLTPEEEWQRLQPALQAAVQLAKIQTGITISVDTRHAETAQRSLALGADWINDVSGLRDPAMVHVLAEANCPIVLMHATSIPANPVDVLPEDQPITDALLAWAEERFTALEAQGIQRTRLIFDPGIGFGKTTEQSLTLLRQIHRFHDLGVPLFVGHSRKRFLHRITSAPAQDRDVETAAISLHLAQQGVQYVRVHNVAIHARAMAAFTATGGLHHDRKETS
jgi:dihydropteroate synthase